MAKSYYLNKIRTLLTEGFTEGQLKDFCFDTPKFRPVHTRLAENSGKDEIVRQILSHAEQIIEIEMVLRWAKQDNPAQYNRHLPYYGVRILLVDDNEDWCDQLGNLLREGEPGYEVVTAADREEAERRFRNDEAYNLAILDMRLDESDEDNREGVALGFWLRNNGFNLPIIIMSAYKIDADTAKYMSLRPYQFAAVEKGKIGSGGFDDLLRQIELALLS